MIPMQLAPFFSVSEFNEAVARHLQLLGPVIVEGELSEFRVVGKWIYATIKDEDASVGVFGATFRIHNTSSLEVGMLVKIEGYAGLYQKTGRFSLQAESITPSGEGALQLAYQKLLRELEKEGLFAAERKRPLPVFPETVGLLTARDSQAYLDFVKVSGERIGGVKILFSPINVQGVNATPSILNALSYFNALKDKPDLLVLTRGGGSLEDLAAFNDERLVRAVYASKIPVVAAIGHEGDVSLVELVADLRASTPSNAAELVFRQRGEVLTELANYTRQMEQAIFQRLNSLENRFFRALDAYSHRLDHLQDSTHNLESRLLSRYQSLLTLLEERLAHLVDKLKVLDPRAALKRGYSLLHDANGKLLTSISSVAFGDPFSAAVMDGTITASVTGTKKGSK